LKKIVCTILLVTFVMFSNVYAGEKNDYKAAIIMETNTGKVLYQYNMNKVLPQASLTKLMTYYTYMKFADNEGIKQSKKITIDVDSFHIPPGGSQIYLKKGDVISIRDLISALLIISANDSARALERIYNSYGQKLVENMNELSKELGFKNSNFVNVSGLTDQVGKVKKYNVTTAYELACLSRLVINEYPNILNTTSKASCIIKNKKYYSTNKLLLKYKNIDGLKTGRTVEAGYCVAVTEDVSKAIGNGKSTRLLAIVLGCSTDAARFREGKKLLDYAKGKFINFKAVSRDNQIRIDNEFYKNGYIKCNTKEDAYILKNKDEKVSKTIVFSNNLSSNISKDDKIGTMVVKAGDQTIQQQLFASDNYKLKAWPIRIFLSIKNFLGNLF
jgi:serine-type D-Ala-D-Ala carboxypeptidase (penicillin-binding protein 5/6)